MQRRDFISGIVGAVVGGVGTYLATKSSSKRGSGISSPSVVTGKRDLKMVTTWPKGLPGLGTGAERIAKKITEATDGKLNITFYGAGELVPAFESFDAVSNGDADIYHAASYYWKGKSQGFNFFTAVPFGLTANELDAWVNFGGGQELWDELAANFNLKPFMGGNTGVQMGGWFRKEINTVEDLKGLKMRIPGLGGDVITKLGGSSITLPGGEIFQSLQTGAIDATEWVGPYNDLAMGFYKVAKYYYYPGFHEPGSGLEATWNLDVWNSLSKTDQLIVEAVTRAENNVMLSEFNGFNSDSLTTLLNDHNVILKPFSDQIYKAFADQTEEVMKDIIAGDELTKRIYESYINFREKAIGWTYLSDQSYANKRRKALGYTA